MSVFLGTLLVFGVACLLLGLGMIVDKRKLQGGCGHKPQGAKRCAECPGRKEHEGGSET